MKLVFLNIVFIIIEYDFVVICVIMVSFLDWFVCLYFVGNGEVFLIVVMSLLCGDFSLVEKFIMNMLGFRRLDCYDVGVEIFRLFCLECVDSVV